MKKKVIAIFAIMLIATLSVTACGKSETEKQAEFIERYNAMEAYRQTEFTERYTALNKERQAEFTNWYNAFKSERSEDFTNWYTALNKERQAEFTNWYTAREAERQAEAKKRDEEVRSKVLNSARPVSVAVALTTTLKQLFIDTGVDKRINEKRAEEQLAPLTADEIYNDFREEGISEIPQFIQNVMEIFEDGTVRVTTSSFLQSGTLSHGWFLGKNFVGLLPYAYAEICIGTSRDKADAFTATFTMHADIGSEDARKKEVLFDGTVRQLCENNGNYPKFYEDQGIVVFKRPAAKLLPVPADNSVVLGSVKKLEEGSKLYYPRITEEGIKVEVGFFKRARKFYSGAEIIELSGEINPEVDAGAPVYFVGADKNSPVRLVGFIILFGDTSAVSAEFVLTGVEEVELADVKK